MIKAHQVLVNPRAWHYVHYNADACKCCKSGGPVFYAISPTNDDLFSIGCWKDECENIQAGFGIIDVIIAWNKKQRSM